MAEAPDPALSPEVVRLRAEVQEQRYREIAESLTTRTTVKAIEAAHPYLINHDCFQGQPDDWETLAAEWRVFRSTAADGGEVWEFCSVGSCSSVEGFAVVRSGCVVADSVTSVSTWTPI